MRLCYLLALCVITVYTACDLCNRGCDRALCASASDGCTECGIDCGPYGCGGWFCRRPTTLEENIEVCLGRCLEMVKSDPSLTREVCKTRCVQIIQDHYLAENATRNAYSEATVRTGCDICNLDCAGPSDPWCSQTASGPIICGTCVLVSDYGGTGYLCQRT